MINHLKLLLRHWNSAVKFLTFLRSNSTLRCFAVATESATSVQESQLPKEEEEEEQEEEDDEDEEEE